MKKSTIKKMLIYCGAAGILSLGVAIVSACGGNDNGSGNDGDKGFLALTANESVCLIGGDAQRGAGIELDGYRYDLYWNEDGYSFRTTEINGRDKGYEPEETESIFVSDQPLFLRIKQADYQDDTDYEGKYSELYSTVDGDVAAVGKITTASGSVLEVCDIYGTENGVLTFHREISVEKKAAEDEGFSSTVNISLNETGDLDTMEYFIPGILYKDTVLNRSTGIAGSFKRTKSVLVKETRTGLPMLAARSVESGQTLTLAHLNEEISSDVSDIGTVAFYTDENYKCGSIGLIKNDSPTLAYSYPCVEQSVIYQNLNNFTTVRRYHPIEEGFSSSFKLVLFSGEYADFSETLETTFQTCYGLQEQDIYDVDLETAYAEVMNVMNEYCYSKNTSYGTITGIPYGCFVTDGHVESDLTMEMGFVGMEISIAYQMMRYGLQTDDTGIYDKGFEMADMWALNSQTDSGVVKAYLWSNGVYRAIPCYLRRMTDGMEGLLDCCVFMRGENTAQTEWEITVTNYANFLVNKQNADGSWYRAYDYGGNVYSEDNVYGQVADDMTEPEYVCADSKYSSAIPIRFLVRMYEFTGDSKYLEAAKKGAEFVIDELIPMGKFGGAACDGIDRTDRETGVFVLYAMNALYETTKEEKYLDAARFAAAYVASWTVLYDYKIADIKDYFEGQDVAVGQNFKDNALTCGLSIISTGHSGVDNFMSYVYYEFFRLYVWTGEAFYYDFSVLAQNNTKRTLDWDGHMGYYMKGLCLEGTYLSEFSFSTAGVTGVWLPWVGNAVIEPMTRMDEIFGEMDVRNLKSQSREELKTVLSEYGNGGKVIR